MTFLGGQYEGADPTARYASLGYRRNPFPNQGQVDRNVYVPRPELAALEKDLDSFLSGRDHGMVWAVQGAVGYGKSNFLQHVERGIRAALDEGRLTRTACRFIPSLALTPQRVVQEMLLGIGEAPLIALLERRPSPMVPESVSATDFGRFWTKAPTASPSVAAEFLSRWLGGQQTYKPERDVFGLKARERLPPAVAFPYLRILLDMLDNEGILKRIVLLLDEFEDVERLTKSSQTEYVQVLKTLLNAFNWRGLYVIIAGQAAAFTTIGESYPSLASRWRSVALQPLQRPDEAVNLASAYKNAAAMDTTSEAAVRELPPTDVDIKATFITLYERRRIVSQRGLLTELHEWVEQNVGKEPKRS